MTLTIKDVAKMAGVSISTVSRVINNSKPVSSDIRDRVLKVIKETGYVPNPVARSLVMKKSQIIGVIVPDISNLLIGELLNGIEEIGRMYDYDILLCNTYGEIEEELKYINLLKSKSVAGIVFVTGKIDEKTVNAIEEGNVPAVYIGKNAKDFDIYSVSIDHEKASYEMTKYLIEKGNKKIAFFRASREDNIEDSERYKGYKKALEDSNIELDKSIVLQGDETSDSGYMLAKDLIEKENIPEAVFASSDEVAIGAMNAFIDNSIKVPEEVKIAGYDDIKIASMVRPSLTTIKTPIYDIGAVSARMIIKMINKEQLDSKHIILPYTLMNRQSTN